MQVIYADTMQTAIESVYGTRSDALLNDLRSGLSNYDHSILTDLGRKYNTDVQDNFEAVSGWKIVSSTRRALAAVNAFNSPSAILPLLTDEQFRQANQTMQRFVMADEVVRHLHQKKRIDGWSDTYQDLQPKVIGHDHYDHRVALNGIVEQKVDEDKNVTYQVTEFRGERKPWDVEFSTNELLDVRRTSMFARSRLKKGLDDLTNLYEGIVS